MALIHWEPFNELDRMFRDLTPRSASQTGVWSFDTAVDLYEDGNNLVAELNAPGLRGSDIDVEIEDTHLRIAGRREEVKESDEKRHYTKEIRRGSFERLVPLPTAVDRDGTTATYENGVLRVVMPKRAPVPEQNQKITVEEK